MKTINIVAAAISGLAATAAIAAPSNSRPAGADTSASAPAPEAADAKYCVKQTPTGSRVPRKLCQTRAQWAAQGIDVDTLER